MKRKKKNSAFHLIKLFLRFKSFIINFKKRKMIENLRTRFYILRIGLSFGSLPTAINNGLPLRCGTAALARPTANFPLFLTPLSEAQGGKLRKAYFVMRNRKHE
ncbi:hypothetical protein JWG41_11290 [Leptospira sp. 201903075]|nr:hypothetical protein [Leptospira chreensis]